MKCYAMSLGMLLLSIAALAPAFAQNTPEPSGQYSIARHGSFALCLNSSGAEIACGSNGTLVYPVTDIAVGSITYASGIGCGTDTRSSMHCRPMPRRPYSVPRPWLSK
ncbi:MAG: hypothetical protein JO166_14720 [Deltaproteobacteria bacterium]|nr:hypothetical protein [Deltaproteobacteria bacterium]